MRLLLQPHQPLHPPPLILRPKMGGLQGCLEHLRWPRNPTAMNQATTLITRVNKRERFTAAVILNPTFLSTHARLMPPSTSQAQTSHLSPPVAAAPRSPSTQRVSAQCNFQSLSLLFSTTLQRTPSLSRPTRLSLAQVSLLRMLAQQIT
jgi:hypothetical protein